MCNFLDYSKKPDLWKISGKRIRERRKQLGYRSKDSFAEKISTLIPLNGSESVGIWERGQAPINKVEQLAAVCQILECDPEYITCQCDTLRKEYAEPAARFGLSESAFAVLEQDTGKSGFAPVIDFLLNNKEVRQSFRSLLNLHDGIKAEEKSMTAEEKRSAEEYAKEHDTALIVFNDPHGKLNFADIPKTDFYKDSFGQYIVDPGQAVYIAEQQLIAEIRKAIEAR